MYLSYLLQTSTDSDKNFYTMSWMYLPQNNVHIFHLFWIVSLHYRVWQRDRHTEFSSLDRVCIPCSAEKRDQMMPNTPYKGITMKLDIIEADKKKKNWRINLLLITRNAPVFTARDGMQTRSNDEQSVCLSICQMRALWQNGRKICPYVYTIRKIIA